MCVLAAVRKLTVNLMIQKRHICTSTSWKFRDIAPSDNVVNSAFPAPEAPPVRMPSMLLPPGVQTEKVVLKGELLQLECIPGGLYVEVRFLYPRNCCVVCLTIEMTMFLIVVPLQKWSGWKWERSWRQGQNLTTLAGFWSCLKWRRAMEGSTCVKPKTQLGTPFTTLTWWWKVRFNAPRCVCVCFRGLYWLFFSQSRQSGWRSLLRTSCLWSGPMFTSNARSAENPHQT